MLVPRLIFFVNPGRKGAAAAGDILGMFPEYAKNAPRIIAGNVDGLMVIAELIQEILNTAPEITVSAVAGGDKLSDDEFVNPRHMVDALAELEAFGTIVVGSREIFSSLGHGAFATDEPGVFQLCPLSFGMEPVEADIDM